MTEEQVAIRLNELKEIQDKRQDKFYSWIKTIITLSVALFGILISFKSTFPMSLVKSVLYAIAISSLGFGILFGLIVLFSEVHILDRIKSSRVKLTVNELDGKFNNLDFEIVKESFFFRISLFICICFYLLSLFSLITYSIYDVVKSMW
ncbi:hypothetical protein [Flavobacterium weaverense]|uniref:Uncharacterized protein n=1 Tax=Flavobacterium weaverense TaxID=271156 RepID=A0A3M0A6D1_9FLAO|nr:hypothetical protein [Flavobacterium weaverense]RMA78358.1 hypothetical protein BC961_0739 [Flavobacterium weaverense]